MSDRYKVVNNDTGESNTFATEERAKDTLHLLREGGDDVELIDTHEEGEQVEPEVVDHSQGDPGTPAAKQAAPDNTEDTTDDPTMIANPIDYLRGINTEFVNTIKGTPAISKRGFRYMQTELGIRTTSEVVEVIDEPKGVIVHARAEMPDGRYAEAHGEGYLAEGDVKDNEFVRYADTRAKNRAISDLTSSGALAESEL